MAESFAIPGKWCDVGTYLNAQDGWEQYCDCAFTGASDPWVNTDPGMLQMLLNVGGVAPQLRCSGGVLFAPDERNFALAQAHCGTHDQTLQMQASGGFGVRQPDWDKCMSRFCLLPTGCHSPVKAERGGNPWDPFNTHPGILFAPWTDPGSAARGIPMRNQSLFGDLMRLVALDPAGWTPLALWQLFWRNKGGYITRVGQMTLASFVIPFGGIMLAGYTNPMTLIPAAIAQCAAEKKDFGNEILMPIFAGTWADIKTAVKILGAGGPLAPLINTFTLGGILAARYAQDQIDTGMLRNMSATGQAIIYFIATSGEKIGREMQDTITSANPAASMQNVPSIMQVFKDGFNAVANALQPGAAQDWARGVVTVLNVAYVIVEGMQRGYSSDIIVDNVMNELFGFKLRGPGGLAESVAKGGDAIKALFASVADRGGSKNLSEATQRLALVRDAFTGLVNVLSDIGAKLGGGVQKLASQVTSFFALFANVEASTIRAAQPIAGQTVVAAVPVTRVPVTRVPVTRPPKGTVIRAALVNAPPATATTSQKSSFGPVLGGAVAGVFVGGPPGAAIGALLGLMVGSKGAASSPTRALPIRSLPSAQLVTGPVVKSLRGFGGYGGSVRDIIGTSASSLPTPRRLSTPRPVRVLASSALNFEVKPPTDISTPVLPVRRAPAHVLVPIAPRVLASSALAKKPPQVEIPRPIPVATRGQDVPIFEKPPVLPPQKEPTPVPVFTKPSPETTHMPIKTQVGPDPQILIQLAREHAAAAWANANIALGKYQQAAFNATDPSKGRVDRIMWEDQANRLWPVFANLRAIAYAADDEVARLGGVVAARDRAADASQIAINIPSETSQPPATQPVATGTSTIRRPAIERALLDLANTGPEPEVQPEQPVTYDPPISTAGAAGGFPWWILLILGGAYAYSKKGG